MALDLPIQDFPGPTFLNHNGRFGHGAARPISMAWIARRKEMMVLDQLSCFRSTNPGLPRTHFSQLQQLFWPQGLSANSHVLDCKQKRNDGPRLAQWFQIYQSRTTQNPLFPTIIAVLARELLGQFSCPGLQIGNSISRSGLRAFWPISKSCIESRKEMMVLDQLNGFRSTNPGLPRTHFFQL